MNTLQWPTMIFLLSVLTAGCSNVIYPDPLPAAAAVLKTAPESDGKKIISAQWMKRDFSAEIHSLSSGDVSGLLIRTTGYAPGEQITVELDDKNSNDDGGSYTLTKKITGVVDKHGEVRVLIKS